MYKVYSVKLEFGPLNSCFETLCMYQHLYVTFILNPKLGPW